jgi:hypothetical protein
VILALALVVAAAPVTTPWQFGVRADPVVFAIGGWSVGVDGMPEDSHWRASMAAFHTDVPAILVPVVAQGPPGLAVTESALQLGAFYDVDDKHRGLYLGPELYIYDLVYTAQGTAEAREAYAHVTAGYTWFPFDGVDLFFVQPWATLGVPIFHSGGAVVDGRQVTDRVLNWHATVSIGCRFF